MHIDIKMECTTVVSVHGRGNLLLPSLSRLMGEYRGLRDGEGTVECGATPIRGPLDVTICRRGGTCRLPCSRTLIASTCEAAG